MKPAHLFARTPAMTMTSLTRTRTMLRVIAVMSVGLLVSGVCRADDREERDNGLRRRIVGTWTTKSFGTQELTNYSNGTARLDVTLNRLAALRYGSSLTLDLAWTVKNGVMTHTIKGGSPPAKVQRLINDWGKTLKYRIVEVTDSHMLLVKPNDDEQSRWEAKTEVAARK